MAGMVALALLVGGGIGLAIGRAPAPAANIEPVAIKATPSKPLLRAMTPEEESYAAALWPIHSEVKLAAIRSTFAGIKYKTGEEDLPRLRATVGEMAELFDRARSSVVALTVPPSIATAHGRYLEAVTLYRDAARMVATAEPTALTDSLLKAQELSFRASEGTLVVGDLLWPAEHKPH